MLRADDVTGLIACTAGGAVIGYCIQMGRYHWRHRRHHIVYDDDSKRRYEVIYRYDREGRR